MLVVCTNCKRIVGCATPEGLVVFYCRECPYGACHRMVRIGEANIVKVLLVNFVDCREHQVNRIGFIQEAIKEMEVLNVKEETREETREETGEEESEGMEA